MYDKIRDIEKKLATSRSELEALEDRLADEAIYKDQERKAEITQLVADQASRKAEIQMLEWNWLEVSEALEAVVSQTNEKPV